LHELLERKGSIPLTTISLRTANGPQTRRNSAE